jgi:protein TonB
MRSTSILLSIGLHGAALGVAGAVSGAMARPQHSPAQIHILPQQDTVPRPEPADAGPVVLAEPADTTLLADADVVVEVATDLAEPPGTPEATGVRAGLPREPSRPTAERVRAAAPIEPPPVTAAPVAPEPSAFVAAEPLVDQNVAPEYPMRARRAGHEGVVKVRVEVAADGSVRAVGIALACPFPELNRAALLAVRGWRFQPARRGGVAVEDVVTVPIEFRLRQKGP